MFLLKPPPPLPPATPPAAFVNSNTRVLPPAGKPTRSLFAVPPAPPATNATGARVTPPLCGREWKYVAEGGANVLFRHHPSATTAVATAADFKGKLLRVKKCDAEDQAAAAAKKKKKRLAHHAKTPGEKPYTPHYPHPREVLQYATDRIMPYLVQQVATIDKSGGNSSNRSARAKAPAYTQQPPPRSSFLQVAELVEVDRSFLVALNEQLLALETRPAHRRHSQIDVALECVMMLPDVTLPPPDDTSLLFSEDDLDIPADFVVPGDSDSDSDGDNDSDREREDDTMTATSTVDLTDEEQSDATALDDHDDDSAGRLAKRHPRGSSSPPGDDSGADSDGNADDDDDDDKVHSELLRAPQPLGVVPRLRRLLSSYHRNIFDCCFRNICVEIKPKIGFKPKGALIPDIKKKVCRFCMHQHYKQARGKVEEISQYCPLDLFSRDPARIRQALRALQRTPQNNFKVFVRSNQDEVVNVITGLSADALPKGAAQARYSYCRRKRLGFRRSCHSIGAETDFDGSESGGDHHFDDARDHLIPDVVELITEVLMRIEILDDLKQMQLLDHISADGVWHIQLLLQRLERVAAAAAHETKSGAAATLGRLVDALRAAQDDCEEREQTDDVERAGSLARCLAFLCVALHQLPDVDAVRGVKSWEELSLRGLRGFYQELLQRFQVATTLKDCSLLLCLRRSIDDSSSSSSNAQTSRSSRQGTGAPGSRSPCSALSASGGAAAKAAAKKKAPKRFEHLREFEHAVAFRDMTFNCVVAVVDLDVKSHKSVEDYYRLDEKIVDNFLCEFGDRGLELALCRE